MSIAGQLQHAATVVRLSRTFIRRLFDLSKVVSRPDHHIRLSVGAWSDLAWWHEFLAGWNGISMMTAASRAIPTVTVTSDASGSWGCGAFCGGHWFQLAWSDTQCDSTTNIAVKELIPIAMAAALWGGDWRGKTVHCRCDDQAVVSVLQSRTSKEQGIMHLLWCLFFFEASYSFHISSSHIAGEANTLADAISRNNMASVTQVLGPSAGEFQVTPPRALINMLIDAKPD